MAKLVKLTSILTLTSYLPCLTSDLETYEREPIFILNFGQFDELNVEIDLKMAKLCISTVYEVSGGQLEVMVWQVGSWDEKAP